MTWIFDGHKAAPTRNTEPGPLRLLRLKVPLRQEIHSANLRNYQLTAEEVPIEDNKARVLDAVPAEFILTTGEESEASCIYHFQSSHSEEFEVAIYYISENGVSSVTIDTEDAEVREENLNGQGISIVHKNNFYQIFWLEDTSNLMFVVYGEDISLDILQTVAERIIHA